MGGVERELELFAVRSLSNGPEISNLICAGALTLLQPLTCSPTVLVQNVNGDHRSKMSEGNRVLNLIFHYCVVLFPWTPSFLTVPRRFSVSLR